MSDQQHPTQPETLHGSSMTRRDASDGDRRSDAGAAAEPAQQVGAQLAKLRETKGWSIDDVSTRLKIAPHKLRELELGDYSHLPDTTFAIGVVRGYAKMLDVDPMPLTDALRRASGSIEAHWSPPSSRRAGLPRGPVVMNLGRTPRRRPWIWIVALVIVLVAVIAVWRTGGESGGGWLTRLGMGGPDAVEHGAVVSADAAAQVGHASGGASAGVPGNAGGDASDASATAQPAPTRTLTELPRSATTDASSSADASSAATTAAALTASPAVASPTPATLSAAASPAIVASAQRVDVASTPALANGAVAVTIKVSQDSWFSVRQRDGKPLFAGLLRAGDERSMQGVAPFRVTAGNRAGIEAIALDGKPVPSTKYGSASGNVARFSLP
jgi:cytoskeleton protein RodZ